MADTLKRLAGPTQVANGTSTLFTGSANHTYAIKSITLLNTSGAAVTVKLGIGGVTDGLLIVPPISIDAGGQIRIDELVVLTGAETLQINVSAATAITATVHGLDQG